MLPHPLLISVLLILVCQVTKIYSSPNNISSSFSSSNPSTKEDQRATIELQTVSSPVITASTLTITKTDQTLTTVDELEKAPDDKYPSSDVLIVPALFGKPVTLKCPYRGHRRGQRSTSLWWKVLDHKNGQASIHIKV